MTTESRIGPLSAWILAACVVLAGSWSHAEQRQYTLDVPDAQAVRFEVPLEIEHAGELAVHAEWDGNRTLGFRLESTTGTVPVVRRSGLSPIHFKVEVTEKDLGKDVWTLVIHALPLSGAAQGRVTVDLPEPIQPLAAGLHEMGRYASPAREIREPWHAPRRPSAGWTPPQAALARATESLRAQVVDDPQRPPDTCRWQDDLLRWLAAQRDLVIDDGAEPDAATGKLVTGMAEAIRSVEEMRVSRDPLIIGPAPDDKNMRLGWGQLRADRLRELEGSLDELMNAVLRNHAPELENEQWPVRLVSCLTASERYFDQRWILGEDRAPNRDLAEAQWSLIQHAADALDALAEFAEDDVIRLESAKN